MHTFPIKVHYKVMEFLAVRLARYEANADFQRDSDYKRRKLPGRSPGNDDKVSIICFPHYCTGRLVRSENEAKILYTVEIRLCFAV